MSSHAERRVGVAPAVRKELCLARAGEVAAPSWMEQSVNVGDVWSLLVLSGDAIGYGAAYRSPRESRRDGIWLRAPCRATQETSRRGDDARGRARAGAGRCPIGCLIACERQ